MPTSARSLRTRLLLLLLGAIALFGLAQGVTAYRNALQQVDQMFDYQLQQLAQSMRSGFVIGPGPPEFELPRQADNDDDILIQIWGADGVQLFRSPRSTLPAVHALLGFSDLRVGGRDFRLYTMQTERQTIQIAQDRSARTARARALAARAVLPAALFAPLLMLVVWWVVSRALAPLQRMRAQVAGRAAADLSPLPEAGLPAEVQPLVAELNALFGRVEAAFDAQKNFVADAAHELRSPLTALKLQAQALRRPQLWVHAAGRDAAVARSMPWFNRAIRLVEQLLLLARAQAGATAAEAQSGAPIDLGGIARLAAADVLAHAHGAGIELELRGAAADGRANDGDHGNDRPGRLGVRGNAEALRTLVSNLLDNAIKYTPAPGRVVLDLARDGSSALLSVDDSGPGIATAQRPRVFDRFFRASDAAASGSGLGLAIVQAIAERHGATVQLLDSPTLGGLRVTLRMPVEPA